MHRHEVPHVVHVQVAGKHLVEFRKVGSQGEQVGEHPGAKIEQELVSVAQLNEVRDRYRSPGLIRHSGTEGGDPHFSGPKQLGIGKIAGGVLTVDYHRWRATARSIVLGHRRYVHNTQSSYYQQTSDYSDHCFFPRVFLDIKILEIHG
jgi:hypothetical protein